MEVSPSFQLSIEIGRFSPPKTLGNLMEDAPSLPGHYRKLGFI